MDKNEATEFVRMQLEIDRLEREVAERDRLREALREIALALTIHYRDNDAQLRALRIARAALSPPQPKG